MNHPKEELKSSKCPLVNVEPYIPFGMTTPDDLIKIGLISKKYGIQNLKLTGGQKIKVLGLECKDIDSFFSDLNLKQYTITKPTLKYVKTCLGVKYCKYAKQDAQKFGLEIQDKYYGIHLPSKLKIGISGCIHSCSESIMRDIGFIGTKDGYQLYIGGNGGMKPKIGTLICINLNTKQSLYIVNLIIEFLLNVNSKKRLPYIISGIGIHEFLIQSKLDNFFKKNNINLLI